MDASEKLIERLPDEPRTREELLRNEETGQIEQALAELSVQEVEEAYQS